MKMIRKFDITESMVDLMDTHYNAILCRDSAIKGLFMPKRAIKFSNIAEKSRKQFWREVEELHAPLQNRKQVRHIQGKSFVSIELPKIDFLDLQDFEKKHWVELEEKVDTDE